MTTALALTADERKDLKRCESIIANGREAFVRVGNALVEIQEKRLYRDKYKSMREYIAAECDFGKSYAYRLIEDAKVRANLSTKVDTLPETPALTKPLAALPAEQQPAAWMDACDLAEERGQDVTGAVVAEVVGRYQADSEAYIEEPEAEEDDVEEEDDEPEFILCVAMSRLENTIVSAIQDWPEEHLPEAKALLLRLAKDL